MKIVGDPSADLISSSEVLITWETNYPGNSKVMYGLSSDLGLVAEDKEERELHSVYLLNLNGDTTYYYKVQSKSSALDLKKKSKLYEFRTTENIESTARIGWEFFADSDYDSAVHYFEQVLLENDEYAWAYIGFGWVYLRLEDHPLAMSNFNTGLTLQPNLLDGHVGRAVINLASSDYENVIIDCNYVLTTNPAYFFEFDLSIDFLDVHLLLAQAYYAVGQYESAQIKCDVIDPENGLDPALPATWFVNMTGYSTYLEALLALIGHLDSLN